MTGDSRTPVYGRAGGSANHSRGSSLAEEGYVPMAPGNGYVEVGPGDHSNNRKYAYSWMWEMILCQLITNFYCTSV